eukprot:m.220672 g.220672  ORF g.220672 m.220672 type:complete len:606 (+) comp54153_c0_seq4:1151-2968(+)
MIATHQPCMLSPGLAHHLSVPFIVLPFHVSSYNTPHAHQPCRHTCTTEISNKLAGRHWQAGNSRSQAHRGAPTNETVLNIAHHYLSLRNRGKRRPPGSSCQVLRGAGRTLASSCVGGRSRSRRLGSSDSGEAIGLELVSLLILLVVVRLATSVGALPATAPTASPTLVMGVLFGFSRGRGSGGGGRSSSSSNDDRGDNDNGGNGRRMLLLVRVRGVVAQGGSVAAGGHDWRSNRGHRRSSSSDGSGSSNRGHRGWSHSRNHRRGSNRNSCRSDRRSHGRNHHIDHGRGSSRLDHRIGGEDEIIGISSGLSELLDSFDGLDLSLHLSNNGRDLGLGGGGSNVELTKNLSGVGSGHVSRDKVVDDFRSSSLQILGRGLENLNLQANRRSLNHSPRKGTLRNELVDLLGEFAVGELTSSNAVVTRQKLVEDLGRVGMAWPARRAQEGVELGKHEQELSVLFGVLVTAGVHMVQQSKQSCDLASMKFAVDAGLCLQHLDLLLQTSNGCLRMRELRLDRCKSLACILQLLVQRQDLNLLGQSLLLIRLQGLSGSDVLLQLRDARLALGQGAETLVEVLAEGVGEGRGLLRLACFLHGQRSGGGLLGRVLG